MKSFEGFRAAAPVKVTATAPRVQFAFRRTPLKILAARVGGVEIPNQKPVEYSLQYIYGIGHTTAKAILRDTVSFFLIQLQKQHITKRNNWPTAAWYELQGIDNKRTRELSEEELTKLREEVDKYTTEGDLRRYVALNIKRLKEINCYRGRRHYNVSLTFAFLILFYLRMQIQNSDNYVPFFPTIIAELARSWTAHQEQC